MKNSFAKVKAIIYGTSVIAIISNCKRYIGAQLNNPNFVLDPTPAVVSAKLQALEDAEGRMRQGDRTAKPERDQALSWMRISMSAWVGQINAQANGDTAKLETTDMEFVKARSPRPAPKKVERMTAKNGAQSGMVALSWTGDQNADFFELQSSMDGTTWKLEATMRSNRHQLMGLEKATEYYFRACAVNKAGVGPYSPVANLVVG